MYQKLIFAIVVVSLFSKVTPAAVCIPEICATVKCVAPQACDAPNQEIKAGGLCGCCPTCFTYLGENEVCREFLEIPADMEQTTRCADGLSCVDHRCQAVFIYPDP